MSAVGVGSRFTDELKAAVADQWQRLVNHQFTVELADGTLDPKVLSKYLIQDHRFLDSFVVLLASMVASCRTLEDRIPGCQFLAVITGKENTYFERSFEKLGVTQEERLVIPNDEVTSKFIELMRSVAKDGSLGEKLAILCVCEWSYLSWAEVKTVAATDFLHTEWIDLHKGSYFAGVVEYLRGLLDREAALVSEKEREAFKQRFVEAVQLEEDFFDNSYK
ncbi:Inherit from COG: Transcriptional activator, tena [Seminavis robusta]|uniref:Inherit from COG: Transcriptional activator, tena n=1 Tax=Seminavis robusta TaxID=568900 RepID=A0A9N8HQ62_9STRA|nr:Inherit from COG: Transcriptional activator, tena [Seminavis robusta]|eukprot:Sro1136_g245210.1 Inherit from COG: Transcriptional activator, tena (221) ;mRNA; r:24118-24955